MNTYQFPYVATKDAMIRLVNQRVDYAVFKTKYDRIEFIYADGSFKQVTRKGENTLASTALKFIANDNESLLQGKPRDSANEFRMRDAIEPRGGVTVIVHFAD